MKNIMMVEKNSPVPLYYQVKEKILGMIKSGELPPRSRLPAELELAKANGISPMTVRQAYTALVNEGVLYRRHGKGTFVETPSGTVNETANLEKTTVDIAAVFTTFQSISVFVSQILVGIEKSCRSCSYNLHVITTNGKRLDSKDNFILANLLGTRQLDGLVIGGKLEKEDVKFLRATGVPFVTIDNDYKDSSLHAVLTDDALFIQTALPEFFKRGRKRIALFSGPESDRPDLITRRGDKLIKAAKDFYAKENVPLKNLIIKSTEQEEKAVWNACLEILDSERPDGIITSGDSIADTVIRAMLKKGLRIPYDIPIASYGDSPVSPYCIQSKPLIEMGSAAMEMLNRLIKDDPVKEDRQIIALRPLPVNEKLFAN